MKINLKQKAIMVSLSMAIAATTIVGCGTSKGVQGGAAGAAGGAIIGGIIGENNGSTATGAILGAVIGGAAGGAIGAYMDKQANEIEKDIEGADVERVGEGIKITFDSGLLFEVNKSELNESTKTNLRELAVTLEKYEDTEILIEGHTDNTGSEDYNKTLSKKRAGAVSDYIKGLGVSGSRISIVGYGETQPIESNDTEAGKQANRRVEMAIFANKKLKKAAEKGDQLD
jgi:outer membrane protein OmpA-like peptidoglycan-associated protein